MLLLFSFATYKQTISQFLSVFSVPPLCSLCPKCFILEMLLEQCGRRWRVRRNRCHSREMYTLGRAVVEVRQDCCNRRQLQRCGGDSRRPSARSQLQTQGRAIVGGPSPRIDK